MQTALLQKLLKYLNCEQLFGSRPRSPQVKDAGKAQGFSVSMPRDELYFGIGQALRGQEREYLMPQQVRVNTPVDSG